MTDADRPQFAQLLAMLALMFNAPMSELRIEGFFMALRDDVKIADLERLIKNAGQFKYFPVPAEILEFVRGSVADRAEIGWLAWRQAAKRIGGGASLVVADPALAETIEAVFGSWPAACALELSDEMWSSKRKEFDRVYRVMVKRALFGRRYLTGTHEQNNCQRADWQKFTPVGYVDDEGRTKQISGEEAQVMLSTAGPKAITS